MSDTHQQDLIDLISLVEEYKNHSIQSQAEIAGHKAHISGLEKEIARLRAKESGHHVFVRELEESVRSLDRQLRHQHIAQSKKDEEIRSLNAEIVGMEGQMNRQLGSESRELDMLRDEKKRLMVQLAMKDQQLHEFEHQIDHQHTKILNMQNSSPIKVSEDENKGAGPNPSSAGSEMKMKKKKEKSVSPISQEDLGLSLYTIGEETSPTRSTGSQSPEARKSGKKSTTAAAVSLEEPAQPPALTKSLSTGSSPRSGKVEVISDASEFGSEPIDSTIFAGMLGAATSQMMMSSPPRANPGVVGGNKWASPRDDSPPLAKPSLGSPAKSPAKPPKPTKKPPSSKAPMSLGIDLNIGTAGASSSREFAAKTAAAAPVSGSSSSSGRREVTLDSGMGIHHSLEAARDLAKRSESKTGEMQVPQEQRVSVESVHTPDTLSPPDSPDHRLAAIAAPQASTEASEGVGARRTYRYTPDEDATTDDGEDLRRSAGRDSSEDEAEGKEQEEGKGEMRAPRVQERRVKTLASIKAIMNKSRMTRGVPGEPESPRPLPVDMSFEREEFKDDTSDQATALREYIRKSKEGN